MTRNRFAHGLPAALLLLMLPLLIASNRPVMASSSHQEGYPPPTPSTDQESPNDLLPPTLPTPMPYVQPETSPTLPTPFPIGSQNGISNGQATIEETSQQANQVGGGNSSLLYLWLGFLGTLLIFIVCVVGATMLFTRRNES